MSVRHGVRARMLVALCCDSVMGKVLALVSKGHAPFEVRLRGDAASQLQSWLWKVSGIPRTSALEEFASKIR